MLTAVLKAVRDQLIEELELVDGACAIRLMGGKPPKNIPDVFYGVYSSSWSPGATNPSQEQGIHETYAVSVAISARAGKFKGQKMVDELWLHPQTGLDALARKVVIAIHGKPYSGGLIERTNSLISGTDKLQVPLRWVGTDPEPTEVKADWFSAEPGGSKSDHPYGMLLRVHFGQAERYQTFTNLE